MKLMITGDICPTELNTARFAAAETDALFGDSRQLFKGHDFVISNLECAITNSNQTIEKYGPCLKAPVGTARVLKDLGVTHCTLSNNHVFDFGVKGLTDTIRALQNVGIGYTGLGKNEQDARKNLYLTKYGETIAVVNVCEHEYSYALPNRVGARGFDAFDTIEDIRLARAQASRVIVIYHGGKEYSPYPSPRLMKVCHAMAHNGADVILCQHSHCIGCYEFFENCHIVYGQGNFHFSREPFSPDCYGWGTGMAVFYDTERAEFTFRFVENDGAGGIRLADAKTAEQLSLDFHARSEKLTDGRWLDGWKEYVQSEKALFFSVIASMSEGDTLEHYNRLGHFLDCEAHHDVLTTLLPTANAANELDTVCEYLF